MTHGQSSPLMWLAAIVVLFSLACGGTADPPVEAPLGGTAVVQSAAVHGFSADAARTGRAPGSLKTPLTPLWSAPVGIQGWHNSPLVVADRVFTSSYGETWNTCDAGDGVVVLDRETGERLGFWPTTCDANGLYVDDERVYTVTDAGRVFAWTLQGEPVFDVSLGENKLYAPPLRFEGGLIVSGAQTLAILDPATGAVRTRFEGRSGTVRQHSYHQGRIYFGSSGAEVGWCTVDTHQCSTSTLPGDGNDVYGAIAIDADVYAVAGGYDGSASQNQLGLYRVSDDKKIWGHSHAVGAKASPALTADTVLFAESGYAGTAGTEAWGGGLYAYDRVTGAERWSFLEAGGSWSSPVVVGDAVLWIPMSGEVHILDLATGSLRHTYGLEPVFATPAVVDGVVYIGTDTGNLHALGPR